MDLMNLDFEHTVADALCREFAPEHLDLVSSTLNTLVDAHAAADEAAAINAGGIHKQIKFLMDLRNLSITPYTIRTRVKDAVYDRLEAARLERKGADGQEE